MLLMLCKLQMVLASNRHKKAFLKVSGSVITTALVVYLLRDDKPAPTLDRVSQCG